MNLLAHELSTSEIAAALLKSPNTVVIQRLHLSNKLGVRNTAGSAGAAFDYGMLIPNRSKPRALRIAMKVACIFLWVMTSTILVRAQVNFEQRQSIVLNENTGSLLTLQNLHSGAFTEANFKNNLQNGFVLGVSGSSNNFFENVGGKPYLFNSSGQAFRFQSASSEPFEFKVNGNQSVTIHDLGLEIPSGNHLLLGGTSNRDSMVLTVRDDGGLYILRNGAFSEVGAIH